MKLLLALLLSASSFAYAKSVTYTKEKNPKEYALYLKAVSEELVNFSKDYISPDLSANFQALTSDHIICANSQTEGYWTTKDFLKATDSVTITDGAQPLIEFSSNWSGSDRRGVYSISFTTSADYTSILGIKMHSHAYYVKSVSVGNLKNPKYEDQWILSHNNTCTIE